MSCAYPIAAWRRPDGGFCFSKAGESRPLTPDIEFACGQCAGCRRKRAAELTTRLVHEGYCHAQSICVCFTYAPENLPALCSLVKRDLELVFKRLRERCRADGRPAPRCHGVGEYSPVLRRPHYHAALFGYRPADAEYWAKSQSGNREFVSAELSEVWGLGRVTFQDWSCGAAAYCAEHQASKLTGEAAPQDGREPEFEIRPRRPGLGRLFLERHVSQLAALGWTVVNGREVPLPDYYFRVFDVLEPGRGEELRQAAAIERTAGELRRVRAGEALECSPARVAAREACAVADIERRRSKAFDRG